MVILGYIQRGGSPTARDRMLASRVGYEAARLLKDDKANRAVGVVGSKLVSPDLEEALVMPSSSIVYLDDLADILSR
jgi:6-phosphofructokinase 1